MAFGRVNVMYHGEDQFSIVSDASSRFDFMPLIDPNASIIRNVGNVIGTAVNYNGFGIGAFVPILFGGGYDVNFVGTTPIPKK